MPNIFSHPYQVDESISNLGLLGDIFLLYSNFKRNFCKQTVENLIRCSNLLCLIWFWTVCWCPMKRTQGLHGLMSFKFLCVLKSNNLKWKLLELKTFETFVIVKRDRGSYTSAHVLLNLLTSWGKEIKYEACWAFYLILATCLKKFNYTRTQMLDSIYHMTLRLLRNLISVVKRYNFVVMYAMLLWTSLSFPKIYKPLVIYQSYYMALFHSQTQCRMIIVDNSYIAIFLPI